MLLFALSVHSQPACCSSYVSLVFGHISVVYANVSNLKPLLPVLSSLPSFDAKRFPMYCTGNNISAIP